MRRAVLIWIFTSFMVSCSKDKISDIQSEYFLKHFDIDYLEDIGYDVDLTPDGGYILIGSSENRDLNSDIVLIKVDKFGNQSSWSPYIIGGPGDDYGRAVINADNGYIIAGSVDGKMALKKIGTDGQEIWSTSYVNEGTLDDIAIADNKIYVVGYTESSGKKPYRGAFDLSGILLDASIPPFSQTGDYFTSLIQSGTVTTCYGTEFRNGQSDVFLIEHGAEGSFSTEETVFEESQNEESGRINSATSGFFIIGTVKPVGVGSSKIFLRKLNYDYTVNSSFNPSYLDQFLTTMGGNLRGIDLTEMKNGKIAILADRTASNDVNIILFILSPDGNLVSHKIFGSSGDQTASAIKNTTDYGLVILGSNKYQGNSMITLIKTDSNGQIWE
jgi:hypothetical protein